MLIETFLTYVFLGGFLRSSCDKIFKSLGDKIEKLVDQIIDHPQGLSSSTKQIIQNNFYTNYDDFEQYVYNHDNFLNIVKSGANSYTYNMMRNLLAHKLQSPSASYENSSDIGDHNYNNIANLIIAFQAHYCKIAPELLHMFPGVLYLIGFAPMFFEDLHTPSGGV